MEEQDVYANSPFHISATYTGSFDSPSGTLKAAVQITDRDLADGWTDTLTQSRDGTLLSLSRDTFDPAGRVIISDSYIDVSGIDYSLTAQGPFGTREVNYSATT